MKKENKVYLIKSSSDGNMGIFTSLKKVRQYLINEKGLDKLKLSPSSDFKTTVDFTYKALLKEFKTAFIAFIEHDSDGYFPEEIEISCFKLNEYM